MSIISRLTALEILDSRGRPTLEVGCTLATGAEATAQVPSGASTGSAEAIELRDRDPARYAGLGCRLAARNVETEIQAALSGTEFTSQEALDRALIRLDGTPNRHRLGANALLGVSLAFARAQARERGVPLFRHFADLAGDLPGLETAPRESGLGVPGSPLSLPCSNGPAGRACVPRLPRPTINLFSGGKHAGHQVAIQDVLVVPVSASTMADCLEHTVRVFQAAVEITRQRYGSRALVADEGGLAPPFPTADAMLETAVRSIEAAGLRPGSDVALAVDVAATHFREGDRYRLDGAELTAEAMIERLHTWADQWPLLSIEDGLAEDAWELWPRLRARLGDRVLVLGDDLLCTQPIRIRRAIESRAASALLLKVNQVGTLSEAALALGLARSDNWHVTISARSGETEDTWLADLATGWAGDHIKVGSITRSERLAKYNRLLAIERSEGLALASAIADQRTPRADGPGTEANPTHSIPGNPLAFRGLTP